MESDRKTEQDRVCMRCVFIMGNGVYSLREKRKKIFKSTIERKKSKRKKKERK